MLCIFLTGGQSRPSGQAPQVRGASIVWQHQQDGRVAIWTMDDTFLHDGSVVAQVSDPAWQLVASADLNADGEPDLVWQHADDGVLAGWILNGGALVNNVSFTPDRATDPHWRVVGAGDMNGDGKPDLLWQHETEGWVAVWYMNGTTLVDGRLLAPSQLTDLNWRIVGAADVNHDGDVDLLWHHRTQGLLSVWLMSGAQMVQGNGLTPDRQADTSWQVRATGDLNADGNEDLIWQNALTGDLAAWLMQGATLQNGTALTPPNQPDLIWRIAAAFPQHATLQVRTPTFVPPPGEYMADRLLTIQTSTRDATIRYTIDGSMPTASSPVYSAPIGIASDLTFKARAFRAGWIDSAVATASYTFRVADVAFGVPPGTYGDVLSVPVSTVTPSVDIRYTVDGSDPTTASPRYDGALNIEEPTMIKARAFRAGWAPSGVTSATYAFRVFPPTISPAGGTFEVLPSVTISSTTPGAEIRYTVDDTDPGPASTLYAGAISPADGQRVIARSFRAGWQPSLASIEGYVLAGAIRASEPSIADVTVSASPTLLNNRHVPVQFTLGGEAFAANSASVYVNDVVVPLASETASSVSTNADVLRSGRNRIVLSAQDSSGAEITETRTVWAGSRTVSLTVTDRASHGVSGARVLFGPAEDWDVYSTLTTDGSGFAQSSVMPDAEMLVEVTADGFLTRTVPIAVNTTAVNVQLDRANNDLSQGLAEWDSLRVAFPVSHTEAFEGWSVCSDPACIRTPAPTEATQFDAGGPAESTLAEQSNSDLRLLADVSVAGEVTARRVFTVGYGARTVSVRYRFATSEIFSTTPQEDYYRVTITNLSTGASVTETRSVSELSYDAGGGSPWRELQVAVEPGQSVAIAAAAANVGDTKYPSALDIDAVAERQLYGVGHLTERHRIRIPGTRPPRYEIVHLPLPALSADLHPYGTHQGFTIVNGSLRVFGGASDRLANVRLEVADARFPSLPVATGQLTARAATALLNQSLGGFDGVAIDYGELFEIDSSAFFNMSTAVESLRRTIVATTTAGEVLRLPPFTDVPRWVRFTPDSGDQRFGSRDTTTCIGTTEICNGDAWTFPAVRTWISRQTAADRFDVNDVSNMNGGYFPIHSSHTFGLDVDGHFARLESLDERVADRLIALLIAELDNIEVIWIKVTPQIRERLLSQPPLADRRLASKVIQNRDDHDDHFHVRLKSATPR